MEFVRAPSPLRFYPAAVFARRDRVLPPGATVPRLEGEIRSVKVDARHLRRYRDVCGFDNGDVLPVTYPHVMAMPLHLALMTRPAFVRLMGLVHISNEIAWQRPLPVNGDYSLRSWIEGHRDSERGQEFDLFTELLQEGRAVWSERSTLLARQRADGAHAARAARATLKAPKPDPEALVSEVRFNADRSVGRRYGLVSWDLNPIHGSDFSARRLGFDRAVAHGMWSMARSLAALGPELFQEPRRVSVEFKLPLFLPSGVRLEHWRREDVWTFVLKQGDGNRPYLAGTAIRL
jgi:acyl dehydratase